MDGVGAADAYNCPAPIVLLDLEAEISQQPGPCQSCSLVGLGRCDTDFHLGQVCPGSRRQVYDGSHWLVERRLHVYLTKSKREGFRCYRNQEQGCSYSRFSKHAKYPHQLVLPCNPVSGIESQRPVFRMLLPKWQHYSLQILFDQNFSDLNTVQRGAFAHVIGNYPQV